MEGGHLITVKWLFNNKCNNSQYTCHLASRFGQITILEWVISQSYCYEFWDCVCTAADYGQLEIIQYLETLGKDIKKPLVCHHAALGNHFALLKWLRQHEYPWNERTSSAAAENANLECLIWILEHGCPWSERTNLNKKRHCEIIKWLKENGYNYLETSDSENSSDEDD